MSPLPDFPDPQAGVSPLLAVADIYRALAFWVERIGAAIEVQWDSYALLRVGEGHLHLAVTGDPPPDRPVRLAPPRGNDHEVTGEVVIQVADCRAVVDVLLQRGVEFLGPPATPAWGARSAPSCATRTGISWRSAVPPDDRRAGRTQADRRAGRTQADPRAGRTAVADRAVAMPRAKVGSVLTLSQFGLLSHKTRPMNVPMEGRQPVLVWCTGNGRFR